MTVEEARDYRALRTLKRLLPVPMHRWKRNKVMTTTQTMIGRFMKGYRVRQGLDWAMDGPINLADNRYIILLKEQKYLLKHIIQEQMEKIDDKSRRELERLIFDYKDYYLARHVDLDLFDMPERAVLQIAVPPT